ncbi:MAG: nitrilase [Deltaproteobacteria bacterium]|nr:nitrilase [Deltaproteobacteria bacterium]
MNDLKTAAVCMHANPGDIAGNLDRIESMTQEASANGADFVCFPELSVTGYIQTSPSRIYGLREMEKIVDRLVRTAKKTEIVLIAGLIEVTDEGNPYIAQIIAGPDGLIGTYRKTHLGPTETAVYCPGEKIEVFKVGKTTFGVQLCYEAHFPEISTRMALMGADIVLIPHASPRGAPEEKLQSWMRHLPARAFDNGLYVIACNQVGSFENGLTFPGVAVVLGPDGRVLTQYVGMKEHILYAELKDEILQDLRTHRMKYFLPERRPSLYEKTSVNGDQ